MSLYRKAVGQVSSWVFTVSLAGQRVKRTTRPVRGKVMREDAEEGLCSDPDHVTLLFSERH